MAEDAQPVSGARTATEFRDLADALRNRVDLFGKTLAAIATLGTTAVGLTKVGDLFPADGNEVWAALACVGLLVAALAAIWVAVRLMKVAGPVFLTPDLDKSDKLGKGEREAVERVFAGAGERFGYSSLLGLQERERSLRNAAGWATDKEERARRTALADEVKVEIEQALSRAQVVVVRLRATDAVSGWRSGLLYFLVIAGLILFAVSADKVSSGRSDPIADAKACAEARKAGATPAELAKAKACEAKAAKPEPTPKAPSAAEARAQIAEELTATLKACTALAAKDKQGPLTSADCELVARAIAAIATAR